MRMCDLATGAGRLKHAAKQLMERWAETKEHWNDSASRQLEETHLNPIVPQLQFTLAALQRLAEVLEKAEQECDDRETTFL